MDIDLSPRWLVTAWLEDGLGTVPVEDVIRAPTLREACEIMRRSYEGERRVKSCSGFRYFPKSTKPAEVQLLAETVKLLARVIDMAAARAALEHSPSGADRCRCWRALADRAQSLAHEIMERQVTP